MIRTDRIKKKTGGDKAVRAGHVSHTHHDEVVVGDHTERCRRRLMTKRPARRPRNSSPEPLERNGVVEQFVDERSAFSWREKHSSILLATSVGHVPDPEKASYEQTRLPSTYALVAPVS